MALGASKVVACGLDREIYGGMATFPMETGQVVWPCPGGSGLLPGLQSKAAATVALKGGGGACVLPAALGVHSAGFAGGHGLAGTGPNIMAGTGPSVMAKGLVAGGGTCKGLSLGLGIGLGLWGPMILAGLGAAAGYTLWRSRSTIDALTEDEAELGEALSNRQGAGR